MDDSQLMRYKRHLMLPQMDVAGQQKLHDASVLVIGAGGLGSPVMLYLAAAGIAERTSIHATDVRKFHDAAGFDLVTMYQIEGTGAVVR